METSPDAGDDFLCKSITSLSIHNSNTPLTTPYTSPLIKKSNSSSSSSSFYVPPTPYHPPVSAKNGSTNSEKENVPIAQNTASSNALSNGILMKMLFVIMHILRYLL